MYCTLYKISFIKIGRLVVRYRAYLWYRLVSVGGFYLLNNIYNLPLPRCSGRMYHSHFRITLVTLLTIPGETHVVSDPASVNPPGSNPEKI